MSTHVDEDAAPRISPSGWAVSQSASQPVGHLADGQLWPLTPGPRSRPLSRSLICAVCANKFISFAISCQRRWVTDRGSITVDNANWPSGGPRSSHLGSCLRWRVDTKRSTQNTDSL